MLKYFAVGFTAGFAVGVWAILIMDLLVGG